MDWKELIEQNPSVAVGVVLLLISLVTSLVVLLTWLIKDRVETKRARLGEIERRLNDMEERVAKVEALGPMFIGLKETLDNHAVATLRLSESTTELSVLTKRAVRDLENLEEARREHELMLNEHALRIERCEKCRL
jgi:hypothetical protein